MKLLLMPGLDRFPGHSACCSHVTCIRSFMLFRLASQANQSMPENSSPSGSANTLFGSSALTCAMHSSSHLHESASRPAQSFAFEYVTAHLLLFSIVLLQERHCSVGIDLDASVLVFADQRDALGNHTPPEAAVLRLRAAVLCKLLQKSVEVAAAAEAHAGAAHRPHAPHGLVIVPAGTDMCGTVSLC